MIQKLPFAACTVRYNMGYVSRYARYLRTFFPICTTTLTLRSQQPN